MPDNPPVTTPPAGDAGAPSIPPITAPIAGNAPAHLEAQLTQLPPHLKEYYEKTIADKHIATEQAKRAEALAAESARKLQAFETEKTVAEAKRLEEQGKYKELYEAESRKRQEIETAATERIVRETLARELIKAGATDEDISELVYNKYASKIAIQDGKVLGAADVVQEFKASKPNWFTQPAAAAAVPTVPTPAQQTGLFISNPKAPAGNAPTTNVFARDDQNQHLVSKDAVDAQWQQYLSSLRGK